MTAIADSGAIRDRERMLPQHQAALILLQARLSHPGVDRVRWLDLACGRGQIIGALDKNLSPEARSRLEYWGYDINQQFARETRRIAERLGFASLEIKVGGLCDFNKLVPPDYAFDFITLMNTVHEIEPCHLAGVLADCVLRLSDTGTLFVYDMERIRPPELGAVSWDRDEVRRIVRRVLDAFGAPAYRPEVGLWTHRTCKAWNLQLQRQYLGVTQDEAAARRRAAVEESEKEVVELLKRKRILCRESLETLTLCGAETAEEQENMKRLLFEFWAVSRALEAVPREPETLER